jgi:hypothetical protein
VLKILAAIVFSLTLAAAVSAQEPNTPSVQGRFFTPASLATQSANGNHSLVQTYLTGVYDLTQHSDNSCAMQESTTPDLLEQAFADYLKVHPDAEQADRPAAGVAAMAFSLRWPCEPKPTNLLAGRYLSPVALVAQIDHGNQQLAQLYLVGVYDLVQDGHGSCAPRGSSRPEILAKVYSDYMRAHPDLLQSDQTAAAIAVPAITDFWSCSAQPKPATSQIPKSFQFLYNFEPKGWRYQRQISAKQWQETYETGQQSHFDVLNSSETVAGCHGILLLKDDKTLQAFIPDSQCTAQDFIFRFVQPDGAISTWYLLGPMEKITY